MKKQTTIVLALVASATMAMAQMGGGGGQRGQGGPPGGMMRGGGGFGGGMMMRSKSMLINREDVQKDLVLTADQKSKLTALRQRQLDNFQNQQGGGRQGQGGQQGGNRQRGGGQMGQMDEARRKAMEQADKEVEAILTKTQNERLDQISLQLRGVRAFGDEDVQSKLALNATQKNQIKQLMDKQQEANRAIFEKMRNENADRAALQASLEKNNQVLEAELMKVLSADQKAKYTQMQGKKFVATDQPFGGRGGRPGGQGGGQGGRGNNRG